MLLYVIIYDSKHKKKVYSNLIYMDGPTGSTKAVSHIEGDRFEFKACNLI